jgi:hypothetical protein
MYRAPMIAFLHALRDPLFVIAQLNLWRRLQLA